MSEDLLPLRKCCLLSKLLSGSAQVKKINPKQIDALFKTPKILEHIPADDAGVKAAVDELLRDGIIAQQQTGKNISYSPTGKAAGYLATLPDFPPIGVKAKAFVLMSLFTGGYGATLKTIAPPPAFGLAKGVLPKLLAGLEKEGLIDKTGSSGEAPTEALNYRLTEQGKRRLVQMPQDPKAVFKAMSGDVVNVLLQYAAKTVGSGAADRQVAEASHAPVTGGGDSGMTKRAAVLTDDALIEEAKNLLRSIGAVDLLPIYDLRRVIREKYGERAASHDELDRQLKRLRGERLRLVAISDRSKVTADQLRDGVPGIEELFLYARDFR